MDIKTAKGVIRAAALANDTVLLEGAHGIGKSEAPRQIADEENYHMETLFLSHQEIGDLIGIPHLIERDGTAITTWSVPIWLQRMHDAAAQGKKCMLFLDELNRAPLDVRQSAMQLVLERQIHEHHLPEVQGQRCLIIAAINPADDYQVDEMDPALLDRFCFAEVEADAKVWLEWARKEGVNVAVRDFIAEHPDRIHWTPQDGGIGATPRSWTKLGNYMDVAKEIPNEVLFPILKGKLGTEIGSQFYSFFTNYVNIVKASDIEDLVNANKDKISDIEELSDLVKTKIKKQESILKMELAEQLKDTAIETQDFLTLLTFLYALEVEICASFFRKFRQDNSEQWTKMVQLDAELNDKMLAKRIVRAAKSE